MRALAACIAMLASTPALAGQQYCSDQADTYYIEKIPFGFAVVRAAYADFCNRDHMSNDPLYTCNGDSSYQMGFTVLGDILKVTMPKGGEMEFTACTVENAAGTE